MKVVLDACVLYPTVLREVLVGVAARGLINPIWSERLLEEWTRTAARRGGAADEMIARGEIARLNTRFPQAMTRPAPEVVTDRLWLPDSGDVHVLATAIQAKAPVIVTLNLRDFPARELSAHNLRAVHPDTVLTELWMTAPEEVSAVVRDVHQTAEALSGEVLPLRGLLKRARLPRLGKALAREGG